MSGGDENAHVFLVVSFKRARRDLEARSAVERENCGPDLHYARGALQ